MRALNLLRYPDLARKKQSFHRSLAGLLGLLLGACLTWGGQHWLALETARLKAEQSRLQTALRARQLQIQDHTSRQAQVRQQIEQWAHVQRIVQHQQNWASLHEQLLQESQSHGLRLVRLQFEADKLELQGKMRHVEAMAQVKHNLSAQWPQTLSLSSMTVGPTQEVHFVWQVPWPTDQEGASPPSPLARRQPLKP
jgi:hypothetical protein